MPIHKITSLKFKHTIYRDREKAVLLTVSIVISAVQLAILKYYYPFPNFMPPDSFSYLEAAHDNQFINMWAIGYSKFLQLMRGISKSHLILVITQYFVLQISLLYFLFTFRHIFNLNKWLFRLILTVSTLNPVLLHISNFVASDCLFTALSIIWYTQLFLILYKPSLKVFLLHSVILLLTFTVRYNSLFYPFISIIVILISVSSFRNKCLGIGSIILLLLLFIGRTQYEYYKKTKTVQYSAFGGWQMAANALYGYAFAKVDDTSIVPRRFKGLHLIVNRHMDSLNHLSNRPDREVGIYYLWNFKSPLRLYMKEQWQNDSTTPFFNQWASMAPTYSKYGIYLILKHPMSYALNYVWPNAKRYYSPPALFMGKYNLGYSTVDSIAVTWFGWKSNKLITRTNNKVIRIADIFSIITPIINITFVLSLIGFIALSGFKYCPRINKNILICNLAVWITNAIFSILSAPIELRYQLFPITITLVWGLYFINYLLQLTFTSPNLEKRAADFPKVVVP